MSSGSYSRPIILQFKVKKIATEMVSVVSDGELPVESHTKSQQKSSEANWPNLHKQYGRHLENI